MEVEVDSGEKRLNELGYKQELRREMTLFKTLAISFSTMTLFTGITPLYGSSLLYAGPASLVWGWVVVSFFTWFVGIAMAEICSSFPTTGSLYFWAAHLAGPVWGPLASWCCAWLETIGLIAGIGTQAYAGSQVLQSIILLCTGTNKGGGYFAPRGVFLAMYVGLTVIWAILNTFALEVIAFIDIISIWWQVIGGLVIVIMLPLVALTTQPASYVFGHFQTAPETTGISSKPYAVILSVLVSQYSLYGYDAAAHLTEETKGADKNGPTAILSSIGIISIFGWAYILALTFSIQNFDYLYDPSNETAGAFVPAQILYDAFHGRCMHCPGIKESLSHLFGVNCTLNTRFQPMQCGYVQLSAFFLDFLFLNLMWYSLLSLLFVRLDGSVAMLFQYLQGWSWMIRTSKQALSIWEEQEDRFAWWQFCGFVTLVQSSCCQHIIPSSGILSIMHPLL
ncbi:amino-acid permease BAT1 homolog isoform X2 [Phoenix dactylifera]|uniref:Amino-acid permease BAT1 homolog isoform X2 n=1 Tax=Phoenix dactylifera TaxID=42345 RepID=A0A8B7BMK6_PHODC|nr:amino-acid permease BAT1 homolog isoform X2 [Phoenix dactylifera]